MSIVECQSGNVILLKTSLLIVKFSNLSIMRIDDMQIAQLNYFYHLKPVRKYMMVLQVMTK